MPAFEVRKSSIGGTGLFATSVFSAGGCVHTFELGRVVTREDPPREEDDERPEYCSLIDGRFRVIGAPERYLNHCCDPNVYKRFDGDHIELIARRDIAAGEEITLDYLINNSGGDSWACNCGAARCRGETSVSFFTLPREVQREYLPLLAPWFVARHAHELKSLMTDERGC